MDFLTGLLGGAGGLISGIMGSNAASQGQKLVQQAVNQATGYDQSIYNTAQQNLQPFVGYGQQSGNALQGLLGIGGNPQASQQAFNQFLSSTPYQFLLNQGLQGVGYLNAPNLYSGATGKAMNNYAQGMAGQFIMPYLNMLQGQEGLGIQAGSNLGNIGTNIAGLNQNALLAGAATRGQLGLMGAGALSNGIGSALGSSSFQSVGGPLVNAFSGMFGGGNTISPNALNQFQISDTIPNPTAFPTINTGMAGGTAATPY